ncbi:hypothetical protein DVW87_15425 [Sphingomonas aracearum]|uniref:Glycosyltransferase RgtA/B/C/D-like domain-containing protein n=1 Tax=Sphingomonas aracearum TaxID=2283317 RepID=A0A369VV54_9SPHN|nr:hypothetical protein DVW87_15425 [Sphingomonas aracearum]
MLASIAPLAWPAVPPLTDLPGHLGRYRILAEAGMPPLSVHYAVQPVLLGNMGVDLLVLALAPLLGLEPAAHLVVALIPGLFAGGVIWLSREVHGRIAPATAFALPLAYALPFQLGFVNFALAGALAILGLALWLCLARRGWPLPARAPLCAALAGPVWLAHSFGWALLGLFVFGAEWVVQRERRRPAMRAALVAALAAAPMVWPQALAMWQGTPLAGDTGDWLNLSAKAQWIASLLRERWKPYDVAAVILLALLLWTAFRSRRLGFAPRAGVPAALCVLAFLLLPRLYAGGAYVDARALPYAVALAIVAIRVRDEDSAFSARLALLGNAFFAVRTTTSIVALALFAREQQAELAALPYLPQGTAVLALVHEPISSDWNNPRLAHIAGLAVARRRAFTNEQWAIAGQQPITTRHPAAAPLDRDPSQLIRSDGSGGRLSFDQAIARFDRATFRYVWTIGFPPGRAHAPDLAPVWSNGRSALYRVTAPERPR